MKVASQQLDYAAPTRSTASGLSSAGAIAWGCCFFGFARIGSTVGFTRRMRNPLRLRFSLAALLGLVALSAALLTLYRGYARERYLLRPLSLPCQDADQFFNTKISDQKLDTSSGYILTKWCGPGFLEKPMRLIGCPWFDRAAHISIHNDDSIALDDLRKLRELHHFGWLKIVSPQKSQADYRELRNHLGPSINFDLYDMRPPDSQGTRAITE